jgi:hypothetical protein
MQSYLSDDKNITPVFPNAGQKFLKYFEWFLQFFPVLKIVFIYLLYNFLCFGEPWLENSGLDSGGLNSSFVKFVDLNIWNSFSVSTTSLQEQNTN